jgi:hypothetical protein
MEALAQLELVAASPVLHLSPQSKSAVADFDPFSSAEVG